ncbi:Kinesin light chain [Seminavis robusta]|uniref:Kinesin light chain n=1 Tax=Seminavis robusta TaxID=568900 RepID=A0A9N8HGY3_9STRA|nr:Kinesin light chain [Seminavis robusta]|eukprot:Sro533_g161670.1 Kinesin light chain (747) ;mRNA; f:35306-37638
MGATASKPEDVVVEEGTSDDGNDTDCSGEKNQDSKGIPESQRGLEPEGRFLFELSSDDDDSDMYPGEDDFPKSGVRLSHLAEFIEACGGKQELEGMTTTDICEKFVKPWTEETQTSFCDWLSINEHPAVGKANVFISHAWKCKFLDVMDAVVTHMEQRSNIKNDDPIIWFCLFSNNQHAAKVLDFEWFHYSFKSAVEEIGHTVMVLSPWNDPLPFQRAWCIWEVYCSATRDCPFEIAMSETDRLQFLNDVTHDTNGAMNRMLATVRAEQSQCFLDEDRAMIFEATEQTIGFSKINSMVFERYRSWANEVSTDAMLKSMSTLGLLYQGQGHYDKASHFLQDCVGKATKDLGQTHPHTLKCTNDLACVYMDQGRYGDSKDLCPELQPSSRVSFEAVPGKEDSPSWGGDHPETLASMNRLGAVYMRLKKYDLAKRTFQDCLERRQSVLGENHPDTLSSVNNLAVLYMRQGENNTALVLLEQCLSKRQEILGEDHPDTLTLLNNVASLNAEQGDFEKAAMLLDACCEKRKAILGEAHPDTRAATDNLEFLSRRQEGNVGDSGSVSYTVEEKGLDNVSVCSVIKSVCSVVRVGSNAGSVVRVGSTTTGSVVRMASSVKNDNSSVVSGLRNTGGGGSVVSGLRNGSAFSGQRNDNSVVSGLRNRGGSVVSGLRSGIGSVYSGLRNKAVNHDTPNQTVPVPAEIQISVAEEGAEDMSGGEDPPAEAAQEADDSEKQQRKKKPIHWMMKRIKGK